MREWLYVLIPVATIIYFVVYPAKFFELLHWLAGLLH